MTRSSFKHCLFFMAVAVGMAAASVYVDVPRAYASERARFWEVQSIDTMKFSRDLAREKLNDPWFDAVIEQQMRDIAATGATHVSIGTPYDDEFVPMLRRWVAAARRHSLSVWFRGNWAGWEGWFGYPSIKRAQHMQKTESFILAHKELFVDGDIFTACPECENGGPGDPRATGDVKGFQEFLKDEYWMTSQAFVKIRRIVSSNFASMNGDVARLVMDQETTRALEGVVTIDHYVKTADELVADIRALSEATGGAVVLGEFGYPIPDLHGRVSAQRQAEWLQDSLDKLARTRELIGLNYWVASGGSTELWSTPGQARPAASVLTRFYTPPVVTGYVTDELDRPVSAAVLRNEYSHAVSNKSGYFQLPLPENVASRETIVTASGFRDQKLTLGHASEGIVIVLHSEKKSIFFRIIQFIKMLLRFT